MMTGRIVVASLSMSVLYRRQREDDFSVAPKDERGRLNLHPILLVMALAGLATTAAGQEVVTELKPCQSSCGIALTLVNEFGEDSGSGMIDTPGARVAMDASGRLYLADLGGSHIWVFGPDGGFLNRIGRAGEGPGEIERLNSLVVVDDGVFSVLDVRQSKILTFTWTGELKHEVRTQGWWPSGYQTVHLDGLWAIHYADLRTADLAGYPLHLVNLETGERQQSFGSVTGDLSPEYLGHVITEGSGRSVWMARRYAYEIELWESGRLNRTIRQDVDWFPESLPADLDQAHGWDTKPLPGFLGIAADDSLLWVSVTVADDRWAEASSSSGPPDTGLYYDTMIEVIDWQRGQVVASARFDLTYSWIQPGLLGKLEITAKGSVRYRTYRVQLDGHNAAMGTQGTLTTLRRRR